MIPRSPGDLMEHPDLDFGKDVSGIIFTFDTRVVTERNVVLYSINKETRAFIRMAYNDIVQNLSMYLIRYRGINVTVVLPSSKKNRELFEGVLDMIKDPDLIAVAGDDRFDFWQNGSIINSAEGPDALIRILNKMVMQKELEV